MVARGYQVVVTDIDGDEAKATAAEIGAAEGLQHDVRSADAHRSVAAAAARHGVLTAWFNNAGVGDDGLLGDLSDDQVRRLVEVNLLGVMWGSRAALEGFGPTGGDIVNTASLSGLGPVPGLSVYAATKAGVVSLTTSLAAELPPHIRVHALCPDGVSTQLVADMSDTSLAKALIHSGGRMLGVREVAEAAVGLIGTRRTVRTVPSWRGGMMRASSLAPGVVGKGAKVFAAQGRKAMKRG